MRNKWSGFGLLLVVPWLAGCVSRPEIRLDTGQGPPIVYTPPAAKPPPVEIRQEEFIESLTDLVLHMPLTLSLPSREGRGVLVSWGGSRDTVQEMLRSRCAPSEPPEGCLMLPRNAPPPEILARMRLALSFAMDSVWEGASVPLSEFFDPLAFKVMIYTAMSTYLLTLMMPDPVTKGLAAVLTLYLVAYLGLGPVWSMVKAGWELLEESERATTTGELKLAGHRFGRVLGNNGMRVFLLLATASIGGQTNFVGRGPRLPGFRQAALVSPARTRVSLEAAGQVRTVVLGARELVVGLAPTAVASSAMGPGGGAPPKKGSLTGRPTRAGPDEKDKSNLKAIERENESARLLAEKGYNVEQNPPPNAHGKYPDYKINGEYADCYAPRTSDPYNIVRAIGKKVNERQAERIVLNLDDSQVALEALKKQLLENPIADLKEILVVRNRQIILFFP